MKTTLKFKTTSQYEVGNIFAIVYNKRKDINEVMTYCTVDMTDGEDVAHLNIISAIADVLKFFKSERVISNQIASGFDKISESGKYGNLPTEVRSKIFTTLKNANMNTLFVVTSVADTDVAGYREISYIPLVSSEINLTKTNFGMSKKFFESCKGYKHDKQWKKAANATLMQSNIYSYVQAVRSGQYEEFIAPYIETLENIDRMEEVADNKAEEKTA